MSSEHQEQKQLLTWVKLQYPNLLYTEDLGGVKLSMGAAKKANKSRCRKGHPDMMFQKIKFDNFGNIRYVGLAIEFKRKKCEPIQKRDGGLRKNKHLEEQYEYLMALRKEGWFACFSIGFLDTQKLIKAYMSSRLEDLEAIEPFTFPKTK